MTFAENLSEQERKRARLMAYCSTWFGCISEVMMDSSAIIIIYITMLNGSDAMSMLTTVFTVICNMLLLIPCAVIVPRLGYRKAVRIACYTGCFGYLLMAVAPFLGSNIAVPVALAGCGIYALQRSLYTATWYPLLDNFLRPEDRGEFFGTMRYSYMLISGAIFFGIGLLMKRNPPLWFLQTVIGITGFLLLGRCYFMGRFPVDPNAQPERPDIKKALGISLTNGPLVGYSIYSCLFYMAYTPLYPLTLIYLKSYVSLSEGQVQLISTIGIAGSVVGFFLYGKLLRCTSLRIMELSVHAIMLLMAFLLFFYVKSAPGFIYAICTAVFVIMFCQSCFLCNNSAELMALARPGNKLMATAFIQTYTSLGGAVGKTASSMLIGSALLSSSWEMSEKLVFSKFQTLFLFFACALLVQLILIPIMPSIISKHYDYYEPGGRKNS